MGKMYDMPIHGLLLDEIYDWDEMERLGWHYDGTIKQKNETLELWKSLDHLAIADDSGRILAIKE